MDSAFVKGSYKAQSGVGRAESCQTCLPEQSARHCLRRVSASHRSIRMTKARQKIKKTLRKQRMKKQKKGRGDKKEKKDKKDKKDRGKEGKGEQACGKDRNDKQDSSTKGKGSGRKAGKKGGKGQKHTGGSTKAAEAGGKGEEHSGEYDKDKKQPCPLLKADAQKIVKDPVRQMFSLRNSKWMRNVFPRQLNLLPASSGLAVTDGGTARVDDASVVQVDPPNSVADTTQLLLDAASPQVDIAAMPQVVPISLDVNTTPVVVAPVLHVDPGNLDAGSTEVNVAGPVVVAPVLQVDPGSLDAGSTDVNATPVVVAPVPQVVPSSPGASRTQVGPSSPDAMINQSSQNASCSIGSDWDDMFATLADLPAVLEVVESVPHSSQELLPRYCPLFFHVATFMTQLFSQSFS